MNLCGPVQRGPYALQTQRELTGLRLLPHLMLKKAHRANGRYQHVRDVYENCEVLVELVFYLKALCHDISAASGDCY